MALMDEFKKEREAIKNGTWQQKLSYFWEYYKWYAIIPTVLVICITSYIYHIVTDPEDILSGVFLNAYGEDMKTSSDELLNGFYVQEDIDTSEYNINLNTSLNYLPNDDGGTSNYETIQVLMAWIAGDALDFIVGDEASVTELAYKGYFTDLTEVLSKEQIEKYEPYFLYMDDAVMEQLSASFDLEGNAEPIAIPDCSDPDSMERPIPIMIDMSQCEKLDDFYESSSDTLAFAVTTNEARIGTTADFMEYLFKE